METAQTIVYTLPVCPNCRKLKDQLKEHGISFSEKDLEDINTQAELLFKGIVPTTAPLLEYGGKLYTADDLKDINIGHILVSV